MSLFMKLRIWYQVDGFSKMGTFIEGVQPKSVDALLKYFDVKNNFWKIYRRDYKYILKKLLCCSSIKFQNNLR
ncbi:hypothetical protein ASE04_14490 [Rhizobium sp. Root708]|nr:hypothetical protein ASE04_14490 [Rhizobium sp. Root708]